MKLNENYKNLKESYLFSDIARKVSEFKSDKEVIRLGIGDVTLPLTDEVIKALKSATEEMTSSSSFKGYGPEQGYDFLRESIKSYYQRKNVELSIDEIFVSDGAKSDLGNILDLFSKDNTVLVQDPVYPVYVDTNIMAGRKIIYAKGTEENEFLPMPSEKADIIYICSPNNPTGGVYNKEQLKEWVDFAIENDSIILFDSAYEAFILDDTLPTSIYEIEGAEKCAIEFSSLSKTAGFTGVRCGYTVVPFEIKDKTLNKMWLRRQTTKFNGVPYIIQKGAEAIFSEKGQAEIRENIAYYMNNAKTISEKLTEMGIWHTGGKNSPYIWLKCPKGMSSWEFFDYILQNAGVVGTPGAGFGEAGEGFFRLTAFGNYEKTLEALERLRQIL